MSTRIDMTPMVDLAFLLLTFFMLTTTFARPYTMELTMPVKNGPDTPVKESGAVTVLLGKAHQVHYYFGLNAAGRSAAAATLHTTSFAPTGIRQVLRERQRQGPIIVLIKATADSKYQDLIDILDEMNITHQTRYALVKVNSEDLTLLKTLTP